MIDTPRIAPIPPAEWTDEIQALLSGGSSERVPTDSTFLATIAKNPRLYRKWNPFGAWLLLKGELPARDRELAILRGAWNWQCKFEWGQHCEIAIDVGVAPDELEAIIEGPNSPKWDAPDRAILMTVDELKTNGNISDEVWQVLSEQYTERQLIELIFLIGHYAMVAWVQNGLRVNLESGGFGLDAHQRLAEGTGGTSGAVGRWIGT